MDSMSSGHSSSGDQPINNLAADPAVAIPSKRGARPIVVKPLDEPDNEDDTPAYRR